MDATIITDLITNLGLPVALIVAMGFFIYKLWQESVKREGKLYDELAACRTVNEKAIETISRYADKLDTMEQDIKVIKEDVLILTDRMEK